MVGASEGATGVPDWLKILAGCGCALAVVAGILVGLLGIGLKWIVGSGDLVPSEWIAGADSSGAFHAGAIGSDRGLAAFVAELFREAERLQRETDGDRWRWLQDFEPEEPSEPADLEALGEWLPTDAALVIEAAGDGVEVAGALNLPHFGRLVRSLVKGATEEVEPHGDHSVRRGEEGLFFGFVGGTLLLSSGRTALERCFDRMEARREAGGAEPALGEERLAGVAARSDVFGVLRDRAAVDAVLGFLSRAEWLDVADFDWLPADPVQVGIGLDLSTQDELAGELVITCPDADVAQQTRTDLQQQIERWSARADEYGLELSSAVGGRDERIEVTFRLRGLQRLAESLARHLFRS